MQIDSGWKDFDRQVGALSTGNCIGGGQNSGYIRPFNLTQNPVGQPCEPGAMQAFDLKIFPDLPADVLACVRAAAKTESVLLYEIHHRSRKRNEYGERVLIRHGYIITRGHDGDHLLIDKFYGEQKKSRQVIDVCCEYISNTAPVAFTLGEQKRERLSPLASPA
jgi:hypothetical protein